MNSEVHNVKQNIGCNAVQNAIQKAIQHVVYDLTQIILHTEVQVLIQCKVSNVSKTYSAKCMT